MTIERTPSGGWWIAYELVGNRLIKAKADTKAGAVSYLRQLIKEAKGTAK